MKVDYKKAWKELRRYIRKTSLPSYEPGGLNMNTELRIKMTEIRKQCTEPQKKKPKESAFEKEARLKREQVDFSDPNF